MAANGAKRKPSLDILSFRFCPEADLAGGWGSAHWGGKGLFPVSWRVSSGMRPLARVERSGGSADLHFLLGEEDLSAGALLR